MAPEKYSLDAPWLLGHKGVDLEVGREVCRTLLEILDIRLRDTLTGLRGKPPEEWTVLPGFTFSCEELAARISKPVDNVRDFVQVFSLPDGETNETFTSLNAYNAAYAYPFLQSDLDRFVLFQQYGISEAFYDSPYYWMCDDAEYAPIAFDHRGEFTERYSAEGLTRSLWHQTRFSKCRATQIKECSCRRN